MSEEISRLEKELDKIPEYRPSFKQTLEHHLPPKTWIPMYGPFHRLNFCPVRRPAGMGYHTATLTFAVYHTVFTTGPIYLAMKLAYDYVLK